MFTCSRQTKVVASYFILLTAFDFQSQLQATLIISILMTFLLFFFAFGRPVLDTQRPYSPALALAYPCRHEKCTFSYFRGPVCLFFQALCYEEE